MNVNYDTFGESITATILALYNEEWHLAMYQHYLGAGYSSFLFYIPLILVGQMTFVTLFSAIFLNTFIKNIKKHLIEKDSNPDTASPLVVLFKKFRGAWNSMSASLLKRTEKKKEKVSKSFMESKSILRKLPTTKERTTIKRLASLKNQFKSFSNLRKKRDVLFNQSFKIHNPLATKKEFSRNDTLISNQQKSFRGLDTTVTSKDEKELVSDFFQGFCVKTIENKFFQNFITMVTAISLILFMINTPVSDPNSPDIIACNVMETIFIAFYILEFVLTVKAIGFNKFFLFYIRESVFNFFNIVNVAVSIASLFEDKYESRICETMKVVRIFRLLGTSSHTFHEISLISNALMNSLYNILKLLVFFTIFMYVFSLFGMKYLKGLLYTCDIMIPEIKIHDKFDCFDFGGDWVEADYTYDNILKSFFTLFVISSSEGWSVLMYC